MGSVFFFFLSQKIATFRPARGILANHLNHSLPRLVWVINKLGLLDLLWMPHGASHFRWVPPGNDLQESPMTRRTPGPGSLRRRCLVTRGTSMMSSSCTRRWAGAAANQMPQSSIKCPPYFSSLYSKWAIVSTWEPRSVRSSGSLSPSEKLGFLWARVWTGRWRLEQRPFLGLVCWHRYMKLRLPEV